MVSTARVTVERAIGILKAWFRILESKPRYTPAKVTKIFVACCILHNYLAESGSDLEQMEDEIRIATADE